MAHHYLLIIGTGSGNSIIGPEHDDLDIAIVERDRFGGTCLLRGFIPSKMYVYAADLAANAWQYKWSVMGVEAFVVVALWAAIAKGLQGAGLIDPLLAQSKEEPAC